MQNKYMNKKCSYNDIKFDSLAERNRYIVLKDMEKHGEIEKLQVHPRYVLLDGFKDSQGIREQGIVYTADFEYYDNKIRRTVVEDVKSKPTAKKADYVMRRKLFKKLYEHYVFKEVVM